MAGGRGSVTALSAASPVALNSGVPLVGFAGADAGWLIGVSVAAALACLAVSVTRKPCGKFAAMFQPSKIDGAAGVMMDQAAVRVSRARERLPFVRFEEDRFFASLRGKLSLWGGMGNT